MAPTPALEDVVREVVNMSSVQSAREERQRHQGIHDQQKDNGVSSEVDSEHNSADKRNTFRKNLKRKNWEQMSEAATKDFVEGSNVLQGRYSDSRDKEEGGDPELKLRRREYNDDCRRRVHQGSRCNSDGRVCNRVARKEKTADRNHNSGNRDEIVPRRRRKPGYISRYDRKRKRLDQVDLVLGGSSRPNDNLKGMADSRDRLIVDFQATNSEDDTFYTPLERNSSKGAEVEIEAAIQQLKNTLPGSFPDSPVKVQPPKPLATPQPNVPVPIYKTPVPNGKVPVSDRRLQKLQNALHYAEAHSLASNKDQEHWFIEVERLQQEIRSWEEMYQRGNEIWTWMQDRGDEDVQASFELPSSPLSPQGISLDQQGKQISDPLLGIGPLIREYEHLGGWNENGLMTLDVLTMYDRVERYEISSEEFVNIVCSLLEEWLRIKSGNDAVKALSLWRQRYWEIGIPPDQPKDDFEKPIYDVRDRSAVLLRLDLDRSWIPRLEEDYGIDAINRLRCDNEELKSLARRLGLSTAQFVRLRDHVFSQVIWDVRYGNRIATSWKDDVKPKAAFSILPSETLNLAAQQEWRDKWRQSKSDLYQQWEHDADGAAGDRATTLAMVREQMRGEYNAKKPSADLLRRKRELERQHAREEFANELRELRALHEELDRQNDFKTESKRSKEDSELQQRRRKEDAEVKGKINEAAAAIVEGFRQMRHEYDKKADSLREARRQEFYLSKSPQDKNLKIELQSTIAVLEAALGAFAEKERRYLTDLIIEAHAHLSHRPAEDQSIKSVRQFEDARRKAIRATRNWRLEKRKRKFDEEKMTGDMWRDKREDPP